MPAGVRHRAHIDVCDVLGEGGAHHARQELHLHVPPRLEAVAQEDGGGLHDAFRTRQSRRRDALLHRLVGDEDAHQNVALLHRVLRLGRLVDAMVEEDRVARRGEAITSEQSFTSSDG